MPTGLSVIAQRIGLVSLLHGQQQGILRDADQLLQKGKYKGCLKKLRAAQTFDPNQPRVLELMEQAIEAQDEDALSRLVREAMQRAVESAKGSERG